MKNQKKTPKKTTYNQWIFGSIILVFLLLNIFSGSTSQNSDITTPSDFFKYVMNGDVEKIDIINKKEVFVYLNNEAKYNSIFIVFKKKPKWNNQE